VAVDIDGAVNLTHDPGDQIFHCGGGVDPDSIRDIDDGCSCISSGTEYFDQVFRISPGGVHC